MAIGVVPEAIGNLSSRAVICEAASCIMNNEPKKPEPEIMPPVPNRAPERTVPEIPPDKDAPEKETPTRA